MNIHTCTQQLRIDQPSYACHIIELAHHGLLIDLPGYIMTDLYCRLFDCPYQSTSHIYMSYLPRVVMGLLVVCLGINRSDPHVCSIHLLLPTIRSTSSSIIIYQLIRIVYTSPKSTDQTANHFVFIQQYILIYAIMKKFCLILHHEFVR